MPVFDDALRGVRAGEGLDWPGWRDLAARAVAQDAVPELLGSLCAGPWSKADRVRCHNALVAAGPDGSRWAELLRVAEVVDELVPNRDHLHDYDLIHRRYHGPDGALLRQLWSRAAALGAPEDDVRRLHRLAHPTGSPAAVGAQRVPPFEPVLTDPSCTGQAGAAVLLPDGRPALAVANGDSGGFGVWDLESGQLVAAVHEGHHGRIEVLASVPGPGGRVLLATGGMDAAVRLWDPASGEPVAGPFTGHVGPVRALAAVPGPDGTSLLVSGGMDSTLRIWDAASGEEVHPPFRKHYRQVRAVCPVTLPDGTVLVASGGGGETVHLTALLTGELVRSLQRRGARETRTVDALCTVPGDAGQALLVSCVHHDVPRVWDPLTGQELPDRWQGLRPVEEPARRMAPLTLPGGRTLVAVVGRQGPNDTEYVDRRIVLGDPLTGEVLPAAFDVLTGDFAVCAVPRPGAAPLLAACSPALPARVWAVADPGPGPVAEPAELTVEDWPQEVADLGVVTAPGRPALVVTVDGYWLRSYDPSTWSLVAEPAYAHEVIRLQQVTGPDGTPTVMGLAEGPEGEFFRWDPWTGESIPVAGAETEDGEEEWSEDLFGWGAPWCAVTLPDGVRALAVRHREGPVTVLVPDGQQVRHELRGSAGVQIAELSEVALPDGRRLVAGGCWDGVVRLWSLQSGEPAGELTGHEKGVPALCVVPLADDRVLLASGSDDGTVRLWDPTLGTPAGDPLPAGGAVAALCALTGPAGEPRLLCRTRDGVILGWDVTTRDVVVEVDPPGPRPSVFRSWSFAMAALPDGAVVTSAGDRPFVLGGPT